MGGGSEHGWNLIGCVISITLYDLYTSVSYLWSWDIKYRTHLFMTVLRMTWVNLQKTCGLEPGILQTLYKCFLLYFITLLSQILCDLTPWYPSKCVSLSTFFLNCLLLFIHKLWFPTFPFCSLHFQIKLFFKVQLMHHFSNFIWSFS